MAGKSIEEILRQQAAQRQAQLQQQQERERAIYEERERARLEYLQRRKMNERLSIPNTSFTAASSGGSKRLD